MQEKLIGWGGGGYMFDNKQYSHTTHQLCYIDCDFETNGRLGDSTSNGVAGKRPYVISQFREQSESSAVEKTQYVCHFDQVNEMNAWRNPAKRKRKMRNADASEQSREQCRRCFDSRSLHSLPLNMTVSAGCPDYGRNILKRFARFLHALRLVEMTERVCHSFCAGATTRVAKRDSVYIDNKEKTKHYYKTKEFAHHIYKLNLHLKECAIKGEV